MSSLSARRVVSRLHTILHSFGPGFASEKLALLQSISALPILAAADLKRFHKCLCFIRAFPDMPDTHKQALALLANFEERVAILGDGQRVRLAESGIAGSELHYRFSFEVATWIALNFPGVATIDWEELPDSDRLDELLEQLLEHSETDYFHSGIVSAEDWLKLAASGYGGSTFDWLMVQLTERRQYIRFWTALYNATDLPLQCALQNKLFSKTANALPVSDVWFRNTRMRNRVPFAKREIARPIDSIRRVSAAEGARILDAAKASLALRHRETDHFNNANSEEVYVADVGKGIRIAINGLLPEYRDPLECTLGYLILSNGVPIGYGGASVLFHQANTGVNIFDEYRGSEAAWFWAQVMRVVHSLTGCNRFIANPYQFGEENSEALKSGAFWFYYRLGYRPVDADVRRLARKEFLRIGRRKSYRSSGATLRQLATCDMHLDLPGARRSELFDESWIELCSLLASKALADAHQPSRAQALKTVVQQVAKDLGVQNLADWPGDERTAFMRLCPIIAAIDVSRWSGRERTSLLRLMRAKGGRFEADYARQLQRHSRFLSALKERCKLVSAPGPA
jgi:hypothetical protein